MSRFSLLMMILLVAFQAGAMEVTLRTGQGGFRDDRAEDGDVGGGQLCLDVRFRDRPVAITLASEHYTKGRDPSEDYEISSLVLLGATYVHDFPLEWPVELHLGGNLGRLVIPAGESTLVLQAVARLHSRVFWRVGAYAEGKYLHADKERIDFGEAVLLLGLSLRFGGR